MSNIFGSPPAQVNTVITNDLIVGDNITATSETLSGALTAASVTSSLITNSITGKTTNSDLTINPTGTGSLTSTASIQTAKNLAIPSSSSTVGQIVQNGTTLLHTTGTNNFFAGTNAGSFTVSGQGNVGIGFNSLDTVSSGSYNVGIGYQALRGNTTGTYNLAIGQNCMSAASLSGGENLAFGASSLANLVGGNRNVAAGNGTLLNMTYGSGNVAIGYIVGLAYNGTELYNTLIGYGQTGVAGENNTMRLGSTTNASTYIYGVNGIALGSTAALVGITSGNLVGTSATTLTTTASLNTTGSLQINNGSFTSTINNASGSANCTFTYPSKSAATYTIATTSDYLGGVGQNFYTSSANTTLTNATTYYQLAVPSLTVNLAATNFTIGSNTLVTYTGSAGIFTITAIGSFTPTISQALSLAIIKNGVLTPIAKTSMTALLTGTSNLSVTSVLSLATNDTIELYLYGTNAGTVVTTSALNYNILSQK